MMKTFYVAFLMITFSLNCVPMAFAESYFDGKKPLLCSVYQLFECDAPNDCRAVSPGEIQGVSHLDIDFSKKIITRAGEASEQQSPIERVVNDLDGKLIIQGIEDGQPDVRDGAGWTISIMAPEGTMVLSTAGDGFAVVGLGACVPKP
jgi:hypothetical protein